MIVVVIFGSTGGWKGGREIEHVTDISFWSFGFYLYIIRKNN